MRIIPGTPPTVKLTSYVDYIYCYYTIFFFKHNMFANALANIKI